MDAEVPIASLKEPSLTALASPRRIAAAKERPLSASCTESTAQQSACESWSKTAWIVCGWGSVAIGLQFGRFVDASELNTVLRRKDSSQRGLTRSFRFQDLGADEPKRAKSLDFRDAL